MMNTARKHNLGHPTLIFKLCKKAGVPFTPLEEKIEPPIGITVRKDESHNDQQIPRAPQYEALDSEEGAEDKEKDEPTMAQGSTKIMETINVLFIEHITWQRVCLTK